MLRAVGRQYKLVGYCPPHSYSFRRSPYRYQARSRQLTPKHILHVIDIFDDARELCR